MPKRALIDQRPWLLASIIAAIAFYFLRDNPIGGLYLILLKGAGVGLLAVYAFYRARGTDGILLGSVLAVASMADMALDIDFMVGGALFALSHIIAIVLYMRNRRPSTTATQKAAGITLLIGAPGIAFLLSGDPLIAIYAVTLGAMAAAAWTSRFPRYRVGTGAVMFVVSDWLIFSQSGPIDLAPLPELLIWPLYYIGQFLIATGVVQTIRADHES